MNKNKQISQTKKETQERRNSLSCKVRDIKILTRKLNKSQKEHMKMLFLEAKWLYNYTLSEINKLEDFEEKYKKMLELRKVKEVPVFKSGDKDLEVRELKYLSSQMKQEVIVQLEKNTQNLSKSKKKGNKVGKLKFKKEFNCINLVQHNITYKFTDGRLKLQGMKKTMKVKGLHQLSGEIANAKLISKPDGYHLKVVTFVEPEKKKIENCAGIDLGMKDQLVTSNGVKVQFEQLGLPKRQQRMLKNKKKYSKNWNKIKLKINKKFQKINNQKKDRENKVAHSFKGSLTCIEDLTFKAWQKLWGRKTAELRLSQIICALEQSTDVIKIDKWFPSTKQCFECGNKKEMGLGERVYKCSCGHTMSRDLNAAKNILEEGLKLFTGLGQISQLVETEASALLEKLGKVPHAKVSLVDEARRYPSLDGCQFITMPNEFKKLNKKHNYFLCGGAVGECLEDVIDMMKYCELNYTVIDKLTYSGN